MPRNLTRRTMLASGAAVATAPVAKMIEPERPTVDVFEILYEPETGIYTTARHTVPFGPEVARMLARGKPIDLEKCPNVPA